MTDFQATILFFERLNIDYNVKFNYEPVDVWEKEQLPQTNLQTITTEKNHVIETWYFYFERFLTRNFET